MKSSLARTLARSTLAAMAAAALCSSAAAAQQSFTLLSTGINSGGTTIAAGSQDPSWVWQQAAGGTDYVGSGTPTETYVPTSEFTDWQADVSNQYHWVSSTSDANGNAGFSVWSTTFDLTNYDPATATIEFKCVADNIFTYVYLNGVQTTADCGQGVTTDFKFGADNTISSGFVAGANKLSLISYGDGTTDGILFDVESAQADFTGPGTTVVPEPTSTLLLATGLVGLVPMWRRRRRA